MYGGMPVSWILSMLLFLVSYQFPELFSLEKWTGTGHGKRLEQGHGQGQGPDTDRVRDMVRVRDRDSDSDVNRGRDSDLDRDTDMVNEVGNITQKIHKLLFSQRLAYCYNIFHENRHTASTFLA